MDLLLKLLCRTQLRRLPVILFIDCLFICEKAPHLKGIPAEVVIALVPKESDQVHGLPLAL